jgi:hypothetical protein
MITTTTTTIIIIIIIILLIIVLIITIIIIIIIIIILRLAYVLANGKCCASLFMMWAKPIRHPGEARTSWRLCRHDVGFAHTSSGLRPDDQYPNQYQNGSYMP